MNPDPMSGHLHLLKPDRASLRSALAASLILLAAQPSFAQTNAESETAARTSEDEQARPIQEIIVTASKRAERALDLPISITALTSDRLVTSGAQRFEDYQAYVPGLSSNALSPGYNQLIVRGITTGANQLSSTVGTYFDEAPTNSSNAYALGSYLTPDPDLFDIARVEVLRGPQGTLYGANALGGVIRYVFVQPDLDSFEARAQAGFTTTDHGGSGYVVRGALAGPVATERFGLRASGFYTKDPGFIDNVAIRQSNVNRSTNYGGRIAALWHPNETISATLSSMYQRRRTSGLSAETIGLASRTPTFGPYKQNRATSDLVRTEYQLHALTVEADLGFANLVSATSYGRQESAVSFDFSGPFGTALGGLLVTGPTTNDLKKFTQELRLVSNSGGSFDYIVGVFYTREKALAEVRVLGLLAPGLMAPAPLDRLVDTPVASRYREYAAFTNVTFRPTERFSIQAGARFSYNEQAFSETAGGLLFGPLAGSVFSGTSDESAWTFSVAPAYELTPDVNIYARAAKGFRPGGPNIIPPGGTALVEPTYESDTLWNYELGLKAALLDRRLVLEVAAYHIDWSDIQTTANLAGFNYLLNGGSADSSGVEVSASWRANGLSVIGNVAYNDTELNTAIPQVGGRPNDRLPYAPRLSGALTVDYDFSLSDGVTASIGAGLRHTGSRNAYFSQSVPGQIHLPAFTLADVRGGLGFGRFDVNLFVTNLFDKRVLLAASTQFLDPFTGGGTLGTLGRPRTFGITAGVRY